MKVGMRFLAGIPAAQANMQHEQWSLSSFAYAVGLNAGTNYELVGQRQNFPICGLGSPNNVLARFVMG